MNSVVPITRRLFAGLSLSMVIVVVTMLSQVAAVPVYLTRWGLQTYGEWLTLTNLAATASLLNLGVQSYVGNLLIAAYERGALDKGTNILRAAIRLNLILCSLALAALFGLAAWPGLAARLQIEALSQWDTRAILIVYGLIYIYGILGGLLMTLFRVTKQMPRQLTYALVETVILISLPVVVALAGGQPLHAALATGAVFLVISGIELMDIRRRSPFKIGLRGPAYRDSFALIPPSLLFFAISLAAQLLSTGMTLSISATAGAAAVAVFSTVLMLTNFVRVVVNQGMNVLWPEITAAAATQGEPDRLLRWHRLAVKLLVGLGLIGGGGICLVGSYVLRVWSRGAVEIDPVLNGLLALYLVIQAPALVSGIFGLALMRQREMLVVNLLTAVISVALAAALLPRLGLRAAALGLIAGQLLGTVWVSHMASRWTSDTWRAMARQVWLRGLPATAVAGLIILGGMALPEQGAPVGRAAAALILVAAVSLVGWRTWLDQTEREWIAGRWLITRKRPVTPPVVREVSA